MKDEKMKERYEKEIGSHFFFKNINAEMKKYKIDFHKKISSKNQSRAQLETMLQEILNDHYDKRIEKREPKISLNKKGMSIFSHSNQTKKINFDKSKINSSCC